MANWQETPDEEIEFVDAENYHPEARGSMTYEQIVLQQINRCVTEGSKEMVGGYFKEKTTRQGTQEIYVPDQRQVYLQCIDALFDLLLPFFDDDMNQATEMFIQGLEDMKKQKIDSLKEQLKFVDDERVKLKLQFQINTGYLDTDSIESKQSMDEKLEIYRFLYQELVLLFNRKKYLMSQAIEA